MSVNGPLSNSQSNHESLLSNAASSNTTSPTNPRDSSRELEVVVADITDDTTAAGSSDGTTTHTGGPGLTRGSLVRWCRSLLLPCAGELLGTFLLTLVICTALAADVLTDAQQGIWQVAFPSGLGVAVSIYISAHISDAHLNPAVTLSFGILRFRRFHWSRILPYVVAQVLGGILAGAFVLAVYHSAIDVFENEHGIVRGESGSELSAMMFGEYFPNPALFSHANATNLEVVSPFQALFIEAWGTGILVFVIFSATNPHNELLAKNTVFIPLVVGITVACLISLYGPLTQAGWNPVRDFCPRLVAAMAGWGHVAIPGPRNGFWVYIIGPLIGGPLGGASSDAVIWCVNKFKVHGTRS